MAGSTNSASAETGFYADLPSLPDYRQLTNPLFFKPCPEDWVIFVTDVKNSTAAIQSGRYKEVNSVGASCIIAVANAVGGVEIPYVFGGDGASFVVSPDLSPQVEKALLGTAAMARLNFQFELRVGKISVREIRQQGSDIQVSKIALTPELHQAVFRGGGLTLADHCIKAENSRYLLSSATAGPDDADFTGLSCRWNEIPNDRGEVLSLIIQVNPQRSNVDETYLDILQKIEEIMGSKTERNPLQREKLILSHDPLNLSVESRIQHPKTHPFVRKILIRLMRLENIIGTALMNHRVKLLGTDWGRYFEGIMEYSDFQKFDGMIRMVVAATPRQRADFIQYLQMKHQVGEIFYGTFTSPSALITCMVFDRRDRHLHLVDGSNGGYAMAARELKQQYQK